MKLRMIDTRESLITFLDSLSDLPTIPPTLYVDLEGVNLSREGTISIVQVYVRTSDCTYFIDVYVLGKDAFLSQGTNGNNLKNILESTSIPKVFFDVRNDSDALFHHHNVRLTGVHDLQLMELATRSFGRRYINGLAKCIERDSTITHSQKEIWKSNKDKGNQLFDPGRGGSYDVFNLRPLPAQISAYCAQDVTFLPNLWAVYYEKLTQGIWEVVLKTTRDRIASSQSPLYEPHGENRALGPWNQRAQSSWYSLDRTRLVIPKEKADSHSKALKSGKSDIVAGTIPQSGFNVYKDEIDAAVEEMMLQLKAAKLNPSKQDRLVDRNERN